MFKDKDQDNEIVIEDKSDSLLCKLPIVVDLEKIKSLREKQGISQRNMAQALNLHVSTYASYEHGARTFPFEVLPQVARLLQVDMSEIVRPSPALMQLIIREEKSASETINALFSQVETIYSMLSERFTYAYEDFTEEEIKSIVLYMRSEVIKFFNNSHLLELTLEFFTGLMTHFRLCTPLAAKALFRELRPTNKTNNIEALRYYAEKCQDIELSLLYHAIRFMRNPLNYLVDENNIFLEHFTPFARLYVKAHPDFIFPLLVMDLPKFQGQARVKIIELIKKQKSQEM